MILRPECRDCASYLSYSHLGLLLLLGELLLQELELVVHGERRAGCQLAARREQHLRRSQQDGGVFTQLQHGKESSAGCELLTAYWVSYHLQLHGPSSHSAQ